ncbi:hypothetical protein ACJIZ3_017738 [Penstemon smallii]|uniref:BHLH domain-containing protein n=1 Tax=Penstemon smallii TaxID=265156 RepID=A0ABD3SWD4_9LAMI
MDKDYFMNSWNGLNCNIDQSLFDPNSSMHHQFSHFDPSPAASTSALTNDAFALRELIGKLGTVAHPPSSATTIAANSDSCYSTPLSSPHKLNFPILDTDPGFAERAAKFSCFGSRSFNGRNGVEIPHRSGSPLMGNSKLPRVSSSPSLKNKNLRQFTQMEIGSGNVIESGFEKKSSKLSGSGANSNEESSVSEQILSGEMGSMNPRKRKVGSRGKTKEDGSNFVKGNGRVDDGNLKRSKPTISEKTEEEGNEGEKEKAAAEPLKDYIHVRARRGQATDSHSLAERVRREKIGERMKLLQDLVPGCNKVTGKALMLDEIINYVQSLQRQVEFLSMKLASVNPELDSNINNLLTKDTFQQNATIPQQMYPLDYNHLPHQNVQQLPTIDGFSESFAQFQGFSEDDLHSIVQMGFGQNPVQFHVQNQTSNMKVER